ncbi:MAG: hypothetical protein BZ138_07625 [Methanosphaera sp. rholeuAM270]|nr:MAG: hypothetical protein BZ138_07625 [Methanosphaera sp. rholeuAM270]
MSNQSITEDTNFNISTNQYSRVGYQFAGWNTKADGSGISYSNSQLVRNIVGEKLTNAQQLGNGWSNTTYPGSGAPVTAPSQYPTYAKFNARDSTLPDLDMTAGKVYKIAGWGVADSSAQSGSRVGFAKVVNGTNEWPGPSLLPATTRSWTYCSYFYTVQSGTTAFKPWVQVSGWPVGHTSYDGTNGVGGWYWTGLSVRDMAVTETTLYAQWTPISYSIAYAGMDGATYGTNHPTSATYDSPFNINCPTKTGYTFTGWHITDMDATTHSIQMNDNITLSTVATECDGAYGPSFNNLRSSSGTVTFTATWSPNTYSIAYASMDDASYGTNHPTSATYNSSFTIDNPTKTGSTFAGWTITGMDTTTHTYGSATTTETSISNTNATTFNNLRSTSGTVTFTANWTYKYAEFDSSTHTLTFKQETSSTPHTNGQVDGTKTYYVGFESSNSCLWSIEKTNIQTVTFEISVSPTSCAYWFAGCRNLTTINYLSNLNTANVIHMENMFQECILLTSLDLSSFNTSNVTNMENMFQYCLSLESLTLYENFDTSNVTYMSNMFDYCMALESLTLPSNFNTSNVTDMQAMFSSCSSLESLTLPTNFNTANVTNMTDMFYGCSSLTSLDISGFDASDLTHMARMFSDCTSLSSLTLPTDFNTSNVVSTQYMFDNCTSLESLTLPTNFNTTNVTNMRYMFNNCTSLTSLTLPANFNTSNATNMQNMFNNCTSLHSITLPQNFHFDGNSIADQSQQAILPTPSAIGYSGLWINSSVSNAAAVTAENLRDNYDGSSTTGNYARGTYVWDLNTYTISYAGMNDATFGEYHPTSAIYNSFVTVSNPTKVDHIFAGWEITGMDSYTHYYGESTTSAQSLTTRETSFKNLRSDDGTVTLTATWVHLATLRISKSAPGADANTKFPMRVILTNDAGLPLDQVSVSPAGLVASSASFSAPATIMSSSVIGLFSVQPAFADESTATTLTIDLLMSDGDVATLSNVPVGTRYEIIDGEQPNGWRLMGDGDTRGTIESASGEVLASSSEYVALELPFTGTSGPRPIWMLAAMFGMGALVVRKFVLRGRNYGWEKMPHWMIHEDAKNGGKPRRFQGRSHFNFRR